MGGGGWRMNAFVALAVGGAEVTVSGYARRPATLAYAYDGATLCNLASIQWPVATASWGVIDTVPLYDAATGGTLIATLPTVTPIEIRQYDIARIPASGISMVLAQAARAFGTGKYGAGPYSGGWVWKPIVAVTPFDTIVLGSGAFGPRGYGRVIGVPLERAFDDRHACATGGWVSLDSCSSGVWAPPPDCPAGAWARAA